MTALTFFVFWARAQTAPNTPPEQPLPFSHRSHADAGMECKTCHANPDPGKIMGVERSAACMTCHKTVKAESPAIQKLATSAKSKREIQWVRVYQIPGFVRFNHRSHSAAGLSCEDCHGPVATRDQLARERDLSQIGCVACHRAKGVGLACTFCHD